MTDEPHIEELVAELTREEKLRLVRGAMPPQGKDTGYVPGIDRVELPPLSFVDGPMGIRAGEATAFPASIALGATWDRGLARKYGRALGREARERDMDVVLGPGMNIVRVPQCGRNFEYYGEDPFHTGAMAVDTIRGIQSVGIAATAKHFVANNQETERMDVSAEVSERALRELYLRPFEEAVTSGDVAAVMAAYNRVNGIPVTQHDHLLTEVLKDEWAFEGPIVTDWWALDDGVAAARAGVDLEMPGITLIGMLAVLDRRFDPLRRIDDRWPSWLPGPSDVSQWIMAKAVSESAVADTSSGSLFGTSIANALDIGELSADRLDDMVHRLLRVHDHCGHLDGTRGGREESLAIDATGHRKIAREVATKGTVLLTNDDGVLPLHSAEDTASGIDRLAIVGPNADSAKTGGGGSSNVTPTTTVSPVEGLRDRLEPTTSVVFERGVAEMGPSGLFDVPIRDRLGIGGRSTASIDTAVREAQTADVTVVIVQDQATEGRDRDSLSLPGRQDELIKAITAVSERTVVVLRTSGPIEMPWLSAVDAVVETWYPGQEDGDALADVLVGEADPGGRLPVTFASAGAYPTAESDRFPGTDTSEGYLKADYEEGVFVGYRWFDEKGNEPLFPFGHGLSYADFAYRDVSTEVESEPATVSVTVENTSDRAGREVVQVYVSPEDPAVDRPPRELAGFETLKLDAGEEKRLEIQLDVRAFSHYDEDHGWTIESGPVTIEVSRSSRDVQESVTVDPMPTH